jgi:hypothetical protein
MMRLFMILVVFIMVFSSGLGCSYHRAYVSYSKVEGDVQVAAAGWDGRRLGPVSAHEGGALWERCTAVAEGSLWVLMDDTKKMGGNATGEIRWIPRNRSRTTADPTCRKKWGWILIWPVLVTPAFQSARVEATAYHVPDTRATQAGLFLIPEDPGERRVLAQRLAEKSTVAVAVQAGNSSP